MTDVRWLTDTEQRAWRSYLAGSRMLQEYLERQLQRDSGMPTTYYTILVRLSEADDRTLRMSELARACHSSRSRLSHAVARLEANGWVRREDCPTDRRGSLAVLTGEGVDALRAAAPGHVRAVRRALFDALTPEQVHQFRAVFDAISEGLAAECAAVEAEDCGR